MGFCVPSSSKEMCFLLQTCFQEGASTVWLSTSVLRKLRPDWGSFCPSIFGKQQYVRKNS